ncbi:hypothetical protein NIA69_08125 [Gemmiger formicilis]|nr:hypothetical protein [Gemmiger formicilis]
MSNTRYAAHASEMRQVSRSSSFFSQPGPMSLAHGPILRRTAVKYN